MCYCRNTSVVKTAIEKVYPILCLLLRNSTKHIKVKTSICVNKGDVEKVPETQDPLIPKGKHPFLLYKPVWI